MAKSYVISILDFKQEDNKNLEDSKNIEKRILKDWPRKTS